METTGINQQMGDGHNVKESTTKDKLDQKLDELIKQRIDGESHVFRHIVEKNHDDWKYSIEMSIGPADNRKHIKVRGESLTDVLEEVKKAKQELEKV